MCGKSRKTIQPLGLVLVKVGVVAWRKMWYDKQSMTILRESGLFCVVQQQTVCMRNYGRIQTMHTKYVFVTGGVVSGLGKGITAASLGRLLKARGYRVTIQKFDPYINLDPGTMSPYQHGEVFVTEAGAETDLD